MALRLACARAQQNIATLHRSAPRLHRALSTCIPRSNAADRDSKLVYAAPLAGPVRQLKLVSLTSASLTFAFLPTSLLVGNPELASSSKIVVASTVCVFAAATTAVLHWATKGYIRTLTMKASDYDQVLNKSHPDPKMIELTAETLTLLGLRKHTSFTVGDIQVATDSIGFKTFDVKDKAFFTHDELILSDPVLQQLLPLNS
eukprot:TRINITY_DN6742_c0_g1_i1.p1 TRINITY_DN6742_c0_g1~~TRINITY_DN6742_c0_g1_i1.p1  ORF type:complete len:202 (+),score=31.00 TRINITY_DN6742_c0_g1_i1:3-608(+)